MIIIIIHNLLVYQVYYFTIIIVTRIFSLIIIAYQNSVHKATLYSVTIVIIIKLKLDLYILSDSSFDKKYFKIYSVFMTKSKLLLLLLLDQ